MKFALPFMTVLLALTACGPGKKSPDVVIPPFEKPQEKLNETKFVGLWIDKADGEELRSTNKMDSRCAKVLAHPEVRYSNINRIDENGNVFIYFVDANPETPARQLGTILNSGEFELTRYQITEIGDFKAKASVANDLLTFTFTKPSYSISQLLLRSSQAEAAKFQAAMDSCKLGNSHR